MLDRPVTPAGDRNMIRLFAAALLLSVAAMPAFACEWNKSAASDTHTSTVASQPSSDDRAATPPANDKAS
jgi:hypothetical protein